MCASNERKKMFELAAIMGLGLVIAGLVSAGWACVMCIKALFGCVCSDDDEDDILTEDENDVE